MDGEIPNAPNVQKPEQTPKKGLLFEILFVIIFLILIFSILNYFNILKLSEIFPNYLGFLPHRTSQQSKQYDNVTIAPTVAPAVIMPTEQSAKKVLTEVLPNILVPSLIPNPSQIVVRPDKHLKQILNESWYTDQSTISATLFTLPNGRDIASLDLFIIREENVSPSPELAKIMIPQVFVITPKGTWGCKPLYQRTYCENFWEEENGVRKGVVMDGPILLGEKRLSSYSYCEHHKENIGLYAWKSCRAEFAKTGVR